MILAIAIPLSYINYSFVCLLFFQEPNDRMHRVSRVAGFAIGMLLLSILAYIAVAEEGFYMAMTLSSPAFPHHGRIPERYTCDGEDISPPLQWSGVPPAAKSLVLIVDDPDAPDPAAPKMVWVHWVLYNLPVDIAGLPEGVAELPDATLEGINDWHRIGYGGPCPPVGEHRYFFKLYALDRKLPDLEKPTRNELMRVLQDHILAEAVLMATYRR